MVLSLYLYWLAVWNQFMWQMIIAIHQLPYGAHGNTCLWVAKCLNLKNNQMQRTKHCSPFWVYNDWLKMLTAVGTSIFSFKHSFPDHLLKEHTHIQNWSISKLQGWKNLTQIADMKVQVIDISKSKCKP